MRSFNFYFMVILICTVINLASIVSNFHELKERAEVRAQIRDLEVQLGLDVLPQSVVDSFYQELPDSTREKLEAKFGIPVHEWAIVKMADGTVICCPDTVLSQIANGVHELSYGNPWK